VGEGREGGRAEAVLREACDRCGRRWWERAARVLGVVAVGDGSGLQRAFTITMMRKAPLAVGGSVREGSSGARSETGSGLCGPQLTERTPRLAIGWDVDTDLPAGCQRRMGGEGLEGGSRGEGQVYEGVGRE